MDIRQEKEYIYKIMDNLQAESRLLKESYFQWKKRLDELDELERRGLTDISVEGYIDLHTKREQHLRASNILREVDYLAQLKYEKEQAERQAEIAQLEAGLITPLIQSMPADTGEHSEQMKLAMEAAVVNIQEPEKEAEKIPKEVIKESKIKDKMDARRRGGKKTEYVDYRKTLKTINAILKESGEEMHMDEIYEEVQERLDVHLDKKNFKGNVIHRANKQLDTIERVGPGIYRYISKANPIDHDKDEDNESDALVVNETEEESKKVEELTKEEALAEKAGYYS